MELSGKKISGCIACYKCFEKKNSRCAVEDDVVNEALEKMIAADGILLGSPTYFADLSANMKALIERCGMVARANGELFKRKAGAAVVAVRRCGASHVFSSLNFFSLSPRWLWLVLPIGTSVLVAKKAKYRTRRY